MSYHEFVDKTQHLKNKSQKIENKTQNIQGSSESSKILNDLKKTYGKIYVLNFTILIVIYRWSMIIFVFSNDQLEIVLMSRTFVLKMYTNKYLWDATLYFENHYIKIQHYSITTACIIRKLLS